MAHLLHAGEAGGQGVEHGSPAQRLLHKDDLTSCQVLTRHQVPAHQSLWSLGALRYCTVLCMGRFLQGVVFRCYL